ncbi:MAG: glycosyltransferase family 9 protein [Bacteroidetes bacterium]|nr:glycosyltransferase family 9 protein [Bacteroidota bacterium]
MKVKNHIKNYCEFLLFLLLKRVLPIYKKNENSLLFINTGEIGDLVVSSVLLENIELFNNYKKIRFLIKDEYLELFENYKGEAEFIGYTHKRYRFSIIYKIKLLKMLRTEGFHTVIHLSAARGILNEELTFLTCGVKTFTLNSYRFYLGEYLANYFDKMYTSIIGADIINEYEKHIRLIKHLSDNENALIKFNNSVTFNENNIKLIPDPKSIVIAPFSLLSNRDWSFEYFKNLISILSEKYKIVLLGSKDQGKKLSGLTDNKDITIYAGSLKLCEIPLVIKTAGLFIGLDSGLTHIALKMNVPLIAIIGGGEHGRFFPYKESENVRYLYHQMDCFLCHWQCSKSEMFCLTEIKPEKVINAVYEMLN